MGGSEGGWEEEGERGGKERKGGREEGRLRSSRPRLIEERDTGIGLRVGPVLG